MPEQNKKTIEVEPNGLMLIGLEREIEQLKLNIKQIE